MRNPDNICYIVATVSKPNYVKRTPNDPEPEETFHITFTQRGDANRVFKKLDDIKRSLTNESQDYFDIHVWGNFEMDMFMVAGHYSSLIIDEDRYMDSVKSCVKDCLKIKQP